MESEQTVQVGNSRSRGVVRGALDDQLDDMTSASPDIVVSHARHLSMKHHTPELTTPPQQKCVDFAISVLRRNALAEFSRRCRKQLRNS
jgi:hypothetical protein